MHAWYSPTFHRLLRQVPIVEAHEDCMHVMLAQIDGKEVVATNITKGRYDCEWENATYLGETTKESLTLARAIDVDVIDDTA